MQRVFLSVEDKDSKFARKAFDLFGKRDDSLTLTLSEAASDSRNLCRENEFSAIWVHSCRDMSAMNLAIALATDCPEISVISTVESLDDDAKWLQREINKVERRTHRAFEDRFIGTYKLSNHHEEIQDEEQEEDTLEIDLELDEPHELVEARIDIEKTPQSKKGAFIISVMSGSGGVGKSTTVATAAYLAASRGFSVVVLDCDFQFGDMSQLMGDVPKTSVDEILVDESLFRAFARSCNSDLPALVSAPSRLERSEELSAYLDTILDLCATLFDVVFVNTGSSWSEVNAQLIEKSSCNIFVLDQRSSSVRSCQHAIDLCMRMGLATGQFIYALNRCERGSLFCALDIVNAMGGANVVELKDGGQEVEELLGMGLAGELAASKNDYTNSLDEMLSEVLP